jgi:galactokinase
MLDPAALSRAHSASFGAGTPGLFLAPGRVNLIGEHTDYAGGFVMPAAIDFATLAAITPRSDGKVAILSANFGEQVEHALDALPPKGSHHWSDYPLGVLHVLRERGIAVPAFSLSLQGDVPLGAGLSSSASVEVASLLAMLSLTGTELPREEMALLAQRAENTYVGANTGIMDQFIACCGAAHHALLLDCRSLTYRLAPIPPELTLVICNTMVKHSHAGGEYNTRRAEVEEATRVIREHRPEVALLRDATLDDLDRWGSEMSPEAFKRARHIISENTRTVAAAEALERGDLATLGRLMAEAHASYRDDFEASAPEADLMVELANKQAGLVGARLTGGGFGGCTVNLVHQEHVPAFIENVARGYQEGTGITPEIYECQASDAAHRIGG